MNKKYPWSTTGPTRDELTRLGFDLQAFDRFFRYSWKFPPHTIAQNRLKETTFACMSILSGLGVDGLMNVTKAQEGILKRTKAQLAATAAIFQSGMPFYYIPRGFCQMVKQTSLGDLKFDLEGGFKPPFRGCQFLIPDGELGIVQVIGYGILDKNTPLMKWLDTTRDTSFSTFALLDEEPASVAYNMSEVNNGILEPTLHTDKYSIDKSKETLEITNQALDFLMKLFAILNAEPELKVGHKVLKQTKKKTFVSPATFVDVPILTKRTRYEHRGDGHHRSPRPHLRRGHVRQQHYGKANAKTKMVWLRPTIVMKPKNNENTDND